MSEAPAPAVEAPAAASSTPAPTPAAATPAEPSPLGGAPAPKVEPAAPAAPEAPATPGDKLYAKEGEAEAASPEGGEKPEGEAAAAAKPEDYADLTLPEGFEKDEASFTQFGELAAKAGVPKEVAQELLTLGTSMVQTALEKQVADQAALWNETITGWQAELATREPFTPANREASQRVIGRALDEYGSAGAREAFDMTGAGHNPDVIQFVYNMAKVLVEGGVATPKGPAIGKASTLGGALYGDQTN